jgi:hypothetical protein
MHRSGTSAVASAIEGLGVTTGDAASLMSADEHNQGGYFEQLDVVALNNEILEYLGGTALEPTDLPGEWRADEFLSSAVERIRQILASLFGGQNFVLKDPRISVLLPLWREAVSDDVVFVYIVRDPWEVGMSLQRRDGSELETGVSTWVRYNQALASDMAGARVHAVVYQDLLDDPVARLTELSDSLREWGQLGDGANALDAAARIETAYHRNVAEQTTSIDPVLAREVGELFSQYVHWRGRHERFETDVATTPWWSRALLAERRTNLKIQLHLQHEIEKLREGNDELREGYDILDAERHRLEARERELRNDVLVRPALALRKVLRPRGKNDV